jgi:hypothetical protein
MKLDSVIGNFMSRLVDKESWIVMYGDDDATCLLTNVFDRDETISWLRRQADLLEEQQENQKTIYQVEQPN